jgi:DNA-binding MarR family transcriptional regulator
MGFEHDLRPVADAETRLAGRAGDHRDELRLWLRLFTCNMLVEGEVRGRLRERFDVTLPRFDLMAQLERSPEGLTLGELSRRLMVSNGNITGLVQRLVDSGHLSRVPHPTDRRVSYVRMTGAGHDAFAEMAAEHAAWIADLFADMPASDQRTLLRLLGQLKQSVRTGIARGVRP